MQTLLAEYLPILIFLGIAVGLTLLIVAVLDKKGDVPGGFGPTKGPF